VKTALIAGCLSLAALWGCGQTAQRHAEAAAVHAAHADEDEDDEDDEERPVALADVPRAVLDAAARVFPGATWLAAVVELEDGVTLYELYGLVDGDEVELEISADGEILEVERE